MDGLSRRLEYEANLEYKAYKQEFDRLAKKRPDESIDRVRQTLKPFAAIGFDVHWPKDQYRKVLFEADVDRARREWVKLHPQDLGEPARGFPDLATPGVVSQQFRLSSLRQRQACRIEEDREVFWKKRDQVIERALKVLTDVIHEAQRKHIARLYEIR